MSSPHYSTTTTTTTISLSTYGADYCDGEEDQALGKAEPVAESHLSGALYQVFAQTQAVQKQRAPGTGTGRVGAAGNEMQTDVIALPAY